MEEQILKTAIEKILKLSKEQVSKVLIFMSGIDAGFDLWTESVGKQQYGLDREPPAQAGKTA
jgi:hypothetical protein